MGLRFCVRAFSSCGKRAPLFIAVHGPLTVAASPVAEHRLQTRRLSSCGSRAQPLRGMWDPPRPGLEPVSPALAGGLLTTAPPGKPLSFYFLHCAALPLMTSSSTHLCFLKLLNFKQIISQPINKSVHKNLFVMSICTTLGSLISSYFCYRLGKCTSLEFLFSRRDQAGPLSNSVVFRWGQFAPPADTWECLGTFLLSQLEGGVLLVSLGCCYISYTAQDMSLPTTKHYLA